MGNALPVQEPTMDEILASIRRIIEGREEPETSAAEPFKPGLRAVPAVAADETSSTVEANLAEAGIDDAARSVGEADGDDEASASASAADIVSPAHVAETTNTVERAEPLLTEAAASSAASPEETSKSGQVSLTAVNDEGKIPFAGERPSAVERAVSSHMEELATLSVARMRAASLEDAVRDSRRKNAVSGSPLQAEDVAGEPDGSVAPDFMSEFDEAAFASELLINAGLMAAPHDHPVSVEPAEAMKLRLSFPREISDGIEPDQSLPSAIDAVTQSEDESSSAMKNAEAAGALEAAGSDNAANSVGKSEEPADKASHGALVSLISGDAQSKINASFIELAAVLRDEQAQRMDATVREMLQPMLSDWLEDNLPLIVERLVREEIERVARGPKRA